MKTLCLGFAGLVAGLIVLSYSAADEFCWKLTRIDTDSVTLIGTDDARKTAKVPREERAKMAAFLGKSVKVHFEDFKGEQWVVRLEAWR